MLNICEKYARKYDILFNAAKSHLLYFGKDSNNDNVQPVLSMDDGKKICYVINVYIWVIVLVLLVLRDL